MSIRAQGAEKISFINNSEPDEHESLIKFNRKKIPQLDTIDKTKSLQYIKQLYDNGAFQQLDILRKEIINGLYESGKLTDPLIKLMNRLVNTNIVQIKRRWLWYLNQNTKITIDKYIYPLNTNIIVDEIVQQWMPNPIQNTLFKEDNTTFNILAKNIDTSLRIMTYNIGKINQNDVNDEIYNPYNADISCYQETQSDHTFISNTNRKIIICDPKRNIPYIVNIIKYDTQLTSKYNIIFNHEFTLEEPIGTKLAQHGKCVNVIGLQNKANNIKLLIYNVHLDVTSGKQGREWRKKSLELINSYYNNMNMKKEYPNAIIIGDFNTYSYTNYTNNQRNQLIESKKEDTYKNVTGKVNSYKYAQDTFFEMGMTIDEYNNESTSTFNTDTPVYISKFANNDKNNKVPINVLKDAGWVEAIEINGLPSPVNTNRYSGKIDFIFLSQIGT